LKKEEAVYVNYNKKYKLMYRARTFDY